MPGHRHHCWGDLPSSSSRICLLRLSLPSATSRECGRQNPTQTLPRETNGRKRARSTASRLAVRLRCLRLRCLRPANAAGSIIKFMRRVIRRDAAAAAVWPCIRKPWLEWIAALVERRFYPAQQDTTATVVIAYSDASPKGWGGVFFVFGKTFIIGPFSPGAQAPRVLLFNMLVLQIQKNLSEVGAMSHCTWLFVDKLNGRCSLCDRVVGSAAPANNANHLSAKHKISSDSPPADLLRATCPGCVNHLNLSFG
jgi:hypothetical protein